MNNRAAATRVSSVDYLKDELLFAEFRDTQQAHKLLDEFLQHSTFSKQFCLQLLSQINESRGVSWELRRLAILMLEHQSLLIAQNSFADFDFLLTALRFKQSGTDRPVASWVLQEGYSTTDFRAFVPEFRRRLARLDRVHRKIKGKQTSKVALREFVSTSFSECKLTLGRYLFTPQEVVDRILGQLQVTKALPDLGGARGPQLQSLPPFEAEILRRLVDSSHVYWVADHTSSRINSLIEYPATSVVLVVKPPGSDYEFEFKRAGRKGRNSLGVVFARNGYTVPPSHRLDGGSMQYLLRFEASAAARIASVYHRVHKSQAPVPAYISRTTIDAIPIRNTPVPALRYFSDAGIFGEGFSRMRVAMGESVAAFTREGYPRMPSLPGDVGLAAQFIGVVGPSQAVLTGTSSFRLNKLATYLSNEGPETYFREGLNQPYTAAEAKAFADTILEEVLGVYKVPNINYRDQGQYVDAALSLPANRTRADEVYLSILEQTARFWGTLMAVRGYSRGESFVGRNVGLRSVWEGGHWKVKVIFMDHDALIIPGPHSDDFAAHRGLGSMRLDERYIWESVDTSLFPTCIAGYLRRIYRIQDEKEREGRSLVSRVLKDAYKKTQQTLLSNQQLRSLFNTSFLRRLLVFDTLAGGLLHANPESPSWQAWKKQMTDMLNAHGYRQNSFQAYAEIIESHRPFLERHAYLFNSNSEH